MTRDEKRPDISQAEWAVMKQVWTLKKTNVREVYEALRERHGWAYNTVRTMLERLREKGYLDCRRIGNMHFYQPRISRKKTTLDALNRFADRVFDGAVGPIVSHLIRQERLTERELEELRALLKATEGSD